MKRTSILILTVAMFVALAAPVGAAKGGKPGKPNAVDVSIEADLWWANVAGDRITYTIRVDNQTSSALAGYISFIDNSGNRTTLDGGPLAPGMTRLEHIYLVRDEDLAGADPDPIIGTVSVAFGSPQAIESASDTVEAVPVPPCPFTGTEPDLSMTDWAGGPCYHPFTPSGNWTISATLAAGKHHPHDLVFTMRDHYPGNWCMVSAPDGTDDRFTMFVFFPADGICLQGGMQGETMPVGNTANFVLVAPPGDVTATRTGG